MARPRPAPDSSAGCAGYARCCRGRRRRKPGRGRCRGCRRRRRRTRNQACPSRADGDHHGAVRRRVPDRVGQQVAHDPGQLRVAAVHDRPVRYRPRRCTRTPLRRRPGASAARASQTTSPNGIADSVNRSAPELIRESSNRSLDHRGQPVGLAADPLGVVGDLGWLGHHAVGEGLGHRADPGQRGAQVVADPGDQLAPRRSAARSCSRASRCQIARGRCTRPSTIAAGTRRPRRRPHSYQQLGAPRRR